MTTESSGSMHARTRMTVIWVAAAWTALLASFLVMLPPLPIDETRYLGVALEMRQSGDFLVPTINGEPYSHKPPLLFWLLNAGWYLFGLNSWWPRLLTGLASLACLALSARIARQLWPERAEAARLTPVLLFGSLLWAAWSPMIMFDILLTFWVLLALSFLLRAASGPVWKSWAMGGAALGLGVLTKGPVVFLLVLPAALLAPLWHPEGRHWRRWYGGMLLGVGIAAAVALAWAIPAALEGGADYGRALFWKQSAGRMADSFAHQRPWWWYLPIIPLLTLPWVLWPKAWSALSALRSEKDSGLRFLLCWLLPPVLIFTLISGKQPQYLLPLTPGAMLLVARALDRHWHEKDARANRLPVTLLFFLLAAGLLWLMDNPPAGQPAWLASLPVWMPLSLSALGVMILLPRRTIGSVFALASSAVLLVVVLMTGMMSVARPWYDLTSASLLIARAQERGVLVANVGDSHNRFRFLGRLEQRVEDVSRPQLGQWVCQHPTGLVVHYGENATDLRETRAAIFQQPFRGGWLAITPARNLREPCSQFSSEGKSPGGHPGRMID